MFFSPPVIYLAFCKERLIARYLRGGTGDIELMPIVALVEGVVAAVGAEALSVPNAVIVRPFEHSRLVVHEFEVAEALFRYAYAQLFKGIAIKPRVIVHPVGWEPGQLTDIELRALTELVHGAGARAVAFQFGAKVGPHDDLETYEFTEVK
jgi:actin-like ATPase involved in cell morphogenesis